MENLLEKEQLMLAYYVQYYLGSSFEDVKKLDTRLREEIGQETYDSVMQELEAEGLINGLKKVEKSEQEGTGVPMATNEGILYINDVLSLDSYAMEESMLNYLDNYLQTSGLEFTLEPVKKYVEESIQKEAEEEPNQNRP